MKKFLLITVCFFILQKTYSQCNISIIGSPCVGTNIQFSCNDTNGIEHYWKFESTDSFKLNCSAEWMFGYPGHKRITLRVKDAMGNTCLDTAYLTIRSLSAKTGIIQSRPLCNTIIDFIDSSYIMQPIDGEQDSIVRWIYNWDDNGKTNEKIFDKSVPAKFSAQIKGHGYYVVGIKTISKFGCEDNFNDVIYISGPVPYFDTFIPRLHCTNEQIGFNNTSRYNKSDSCIWLWDWGDNQFSNQFDTFQKDDTVRHQYIAKGQYNVRLYLYYTMLNSNGISKKCSLVFPDTSGLNLDPVKLTLSECNTSSLVSVHESPPATVLPNPAIDIFRIIGADDQEIEVYNSLGMMVHRFFNDPNSSILVESWPAGIYLLNNPQGRIIGKLIIAR